MLSNTLPNEKLCFLRPTLVYGKGDPHNGYGPNRFIRQLKKDEDIMLFGEGEERRDHVWVEDIADIVRLVLIKKCSGIFNIATGEVISFKDLAYEIKIKLSNSKIVTSKRIGPMPHNGYRAFNPSKVLNEFPEFKYTNIVDGLKNFMNNDQIIKQEKFYPNFLIKTSKEKFVGALFLFNPEDLSLLLQHRDEKPNLRHSGMWYHPVDIVNVEKLLMSAFVENFLKKQIIFVMIFIGSSSLYQKSKLAVIFFSNFLEFL